MYFYEKKYYWILNKFDETIRIKQHMPKWILDFNINDYKIEDLERMDNDNFKVSISIERWKSFYYVHLFGDYIISYFYKPLTH